MEKIITITQTTNLLLQYNTTVDTFYVRNRNTMAIIFRCCDLGTLKNWTTTKYDAYPREELQQIVGATVMVISEQKLRYKNLIDTVFQKNDNNNGSQI